MKANHSNFSIEIKFIHQCAEWIPTIAQWLFKEFVHLEEGLKDAKTIEMRFLERIHENRCPLAYVVFFNGSVIGTGSLILDDGLQEYAHLSPWLADMYVLPSYRRQGIGTLIVQHLIGVAKLGKHKKCYLYTEDKENFYKSFGWTYLAKTIHNKNNVTVMELSL